MAPWQKFFKDKKVTQLGLGLLGRGLNDAKFLSRHCQEVIITDLKSKEDLASSVLEIEDLGNIKFVLGEQRLQDFENRDFILKAAGVPLDSPYIEHARKKNIPIEMDASLFVKLVPDGVTIIGITGTRGKTTTTYLIEKILRDAGKSVYLGGNIRGIATLPLLEIVKSGDYIVLELDSWQLQGFGEAKISPHIAVFTNLLPDHLNYYKEDTNQYFRDKANIFRFQKISDFLITNNNTLQIISDHRERPLSEIRLRRVEDFPSGWNLNLVGEHFKEKAAFAIAVAEIIGIEKEQIKKSVEDFSGVSGRLEFISEKDGIKIYNDTTATTPEATLAALSAFPDNKNIILIIGGSDKELPLESLVNQLKQKPPKNIVLLAGSGSDKIRPLLSNANIIFEDAKTIKDAVYMAQNNAKSGDIILFSPAFASFGMFKNEYDRGDQFNELVGKK